MKQFLEIGFSNRNAVARATDGLVDHGRHVRLAEVFGDIVLSQVTIRPTARTGHPQALPDAPLASVRRGWQSCAGSVSSCTRHNFFQKE